MFCEPGMFYVVTSAGYLSSDGEERMAVHLHELLRRETHDIYKEAAVICTLLAIDGHLHPQGGRKSNRVIRSKLSA